VFGARWNYREREQAGPRGAKRDRAVALHAPIAGKCTRCPVRISLDPEPSGRGAALAVAEQLGALADIASAPDRLSRPIEPDPTATEIYDRARARFNELYEKLIATPSRHSGVNK
jgi:sugar (pentulose or hexulose) kinase